MTFEEFFLKKRIDLKLLAKNEPELFAEFWLHFAEMGEKSFDHTKKYLFNKLRHKYPLQESDIPVPVKTAPATPAPAGSRPAPSAKKTGTSAPGAPQKPAGFKPRFAAARKKTAPQAPPEAGEREAASTHAQTENAQSPASSQTQPEKPARLVYKPRFKPGMVKTRQKTDPEAPKADKNTGKEEKDDPKPELPDVNSENGPRQPGTQPATPTEKEETPAEEKPKTPYKPRFRPGVTRKKDQ